MKSLQNLILFIFIIAIFGYISFLTVAPQIIEKNIDSSALQKDIFSITKLNSEFKKPTVNTTKNLGIVYKFREVNIKYPDNKKLIKAARIDIEIDALSLIFRNIKFNDIKLIAPEIDEIILKNKNSKVTDYLNDHFSLKLLNSLHPQLKNYSLTVPPITLINYRIMTTDVRTGKNTPSNGKEMIIEKVNVINYIEPFLTSKEEKSKDTIKVY